MAASRSDRTGGSAGAAVLEHARRSCTGLKEALAGAVIDGEWLAAGPLRVGVRSVCGNGYFPVGNALGEAHPIVAEGISMAIQSACLLTDHLIDAGPGADNATLSLIASRYEAQFRANFSARMRWASLIAAVAMRPRLTASAIALFARAPGLLDMGARWPGRRGHCALHPDRGGACRAAQDCTTLPRLPVPLLSSTIARLRSLQLP